MSAETIIQIKRSTATSTPSQLQPGELAYTSNGEVLFIGSPVGSDTANVVPIAGKRFPGTLTANQALVTNTSNWIDKIQTGKLIIGETNETVNVTSISTDGNLGTVSNNQLVTSWAVKNYVDSMGSSATLGGMTDVTLSSTANNDILVYDNVSQQWENHTIGGTVNEVEVTFDNQNITIGLPDSVTITNQISANTLNVTNTTESTNTTTGSATIAGGLGVTKKINTKELAVGNSTIYTSVNSTIIETGSLLATNTVNAAILSVGTDVVANSSGVFTTQVVNGAVIQVGNKFKANSTQVTFANDVAVSANGTVGSAGQVLTSNGSTVYWSTIAADITAVSAGDGLTGGGSTGDVTLSVAAANGIISNSSGVGIKAGTGVTVDADGVKIGQAVGTTDNVTFNAVTINGNTHLGSDSSDNVTFNGRVNTHVLPQANVTYNLGSQDNTWLSVHANTIHAEYGNFDHDVTIAGNLTVTGTLVTINVSTLSVSDSLIQLAANNTSTDTLDIGFFGSYQINGGDHEHTGLFRDATDGRYKLFQGLNPSPSTTVDTTDASFSLATLQAYLVSGGLTSNSSSITITANSTLDVAITANTVSLITALAVGSGGTGQSSLTNNAVLFGQNTSAVGLATGTAYQILQMSSSGVPVFGDLDGGTF
jgi:hypothetical protein